MAKVTVKNLSKIYAGEKGQDVIAVKDVNLEVADREFFVLVGPSGCGKSTTLRMIAGLEEISRGDVSIDDKRVNGVAPKDRGTAMVFQDYALYPHMSVFDNLAFGLKLRKFPKAEIKKRVLEAASILGIESVLEGKPKALSGSQRQRVALGRAIVRQAKILLFDEPLSNLDASVRVQMRTEITRLHQRLQATMIYATHDPTEAMALGDRIAIMNDGVVQQNNTALKLYNEPVNLFVAGFFGSPPMNFISGTLKADGEKIRFCESEGGTINVVFPAGEKPAAREYIGKPIILGIRPEDFDVTKFDREEGRRLAAANGFPAIVDIVEPMGAQTNLYVQTGAHTLVCRSQELIEHSEAGRRFHFEMNLGKVSLFDPVSTRRLAFDPDKQTGA